MNIFRIDQMAYKADQVSWTDKPGSVFIHTVDRSLNDERLKKLRDKELALVI